MVGHPSAPSASRRLKIIHVFRAPLGGLFRHVLDVARGQIERGHAVGILCDSTTGGTRADETLAELAPDLALGVHRMVMRRPFHPRDALALAEMCRLCRRFDPDVVHGHGSKGGAYARLSALVSPRAVRAYTPHGGSFNYKPGTWIHKFYMQAERQLNLLTDAFLFESEYVRERFEAYAGPTDRLVRVVHNGISESEFTPIEHIPDPFDLIYIGELREAKGVDTLIDALALIKARGGPRLTMLAVGSGPSEAELHARAKAAGLWQSIAFVPPQPIRRVLARGRIMVIPSKAESLPYVILEAAAAAQPLVSTNVGGIGEIFGPWRDELIPCGDPAVMADAILAKVGETEDVRRGKAMALSRHLRTGFSLDKMVDDGLQGYRDAMETRAGGSKGPSLTLLPQSR